jgi:hypothetical protein
VGQNDRNRSYRFSAYRLAGGVLRLRLAHTWEETTPKEFKTAHADGTFTEDAWHHIAVVVTTADGGTHRYYLNGEEIGATKDLGFERIRPSGAPTYIGGQDGFEGLIDEVRIYNRALSAEEVARLTKAAAGG